MKNSVSRETQVARTTHAYFKTRDTEESVLEFDEISKVELKKVNVQSFNTRWDETAIVIMKRHDGEFFRNMLPSALGTFARSVISSVTRLQVVSTIRTNDNSADCI